MVSFPEWISSACFVHLNQPSIHVMLAYLLHSLLPFADPRSPTPKPHIVGGKTIARWYVILFHVNCSADVDCRTFALRHHRRCRGCSPNLGLPITLTGLKRSLLRHFYSKLITSTILVSIFPSNLDAFVQSSSLRLHCIPCFAYYDDTTLHHIQSHWVT